MRLIDADKLRKDVLDLPDCYNGFSDTYDKARILDLVDEQPTVDPIKHGHWIEVQRIHEKDHTAICECSLCGDTVWVYDGQRAWNYCPTCGAKMDEVET